jgi:ApaG protein
MSSPKFTVSVATRHMPDQSQPDASIFAFAYTITIKNVGDVSAQLIARHWVITDANGSIDEVRGLGVVGHQPLLKPGESFEYTSGTRLPTPYGSMRGTYTCFTEDAEPFEAIIDEFTLAVASSLH